MSNLSEHTHTRTHQYVAAQVDAVQGRDDLSCGVRGVRFKSQSFIDAAAADRVDHSSQAIIAAAPSTHLRRHMMAQRTAYYYKTHLEIPEEAPRELEGTTRHVDEAAVDALAVQRQGVPDDLVDVLLYICMHASGGEYEETNDSAVGGAAATK